MAHDTATKLTLVPVPGPAAEAPSREDIARVVYVDAPVVLGVVLELDGSQARVRVGAHESWLAIDASVDPALLEQAAARGARVVIDNSSGPCVVGVLMTARALEIDRKGNLEAHLKRLALHVEDAVIQSPRAFLRIRDRAAELFGEETVVRGRLLARILGKTIKLN